MVWEGAKKKLEDLWSGLKPNGKRETPEPSPTAIKGYINS
jgi:hypothetical protein